MTATDELRKLLDERGVEWVCYGYENHTWWNGWHAENRPSVNGLFVKLEAVCTPERAIAATLGNGMCRLEETEWVSLQCPMYRCSGCGGMFENGRGDYRYCPYCGAKVVDE